MKPDLKAIRERAEKEAKPFTNYQLSPFYDGPRRGDNRGKAKETLALLDYIDRLLEDYEKLTQREMADLNLIDRLKEKLVEERATVLCLLDDAKWSGQPYTRASLDAGASWFKTDARAKIEKELSE